MYSSAKRRTMAGKVVLCEPCLYVEIETEAVGFCSTCAECLCSKCIFEHRKAKVTRNHSVKQGIIPENVEIIQAMNEMLACPVHREMKIAYRCNDHGVCICTACRVDTHRKCNSVFEIATTNYADRDLRMHENLAELVDSAVSVRKRLEENKRNLYQNQTEIVSGQEAFIQDAINALEELKAKSKKETDEQLQVAVSEIDKDIESIEAIEKSGTRNQDILGAALKYGDTECPNIITHLLAEALVKHKDRVSDLQKKDELKLIFEKNLNCTNVSSLGTISVIRSERSEDKTKSEFGIEQTSDEIPESISKEEYVEEATVNIAPPLSVPTLAENLFISRTMTVDVSEETDRNWSSIYGSVVLQDGHFVIIDYENSNIKLLSTELALLHFLKLPGKPVRICAIATDKVAVSFERVKRINRYAIHANALSYEGGFSTTLFNHGIAFDGNNIVALMSDEEFLTAVNAKDDTIQVEIRNVYNGKIIDVIREFRVVGNKSWSLVLNNVCAINVTEDKSLIIAEQNRILCFLLTKESRKTVAIEKRYFVCSGDANIPKDSIENITSDRDNIYVCTDNGSILQISASDYTMNRVIVPAQGMCICSITVDNARCRIILGCESNDNLHVYEFQKSM